MRKKIFAYINNAATTVTAVSVTMPKVIEGISLFPLPGQVGRSFAVFTGISSYSKTGFSVFHLARISTHSHHKYPPVDSKILFDFSGDFLR